jgi:hypothetical protein
VVVGPDESFREYDGPGAGTAWCWTRYVLARSRDGQRLLAVVERDDEAIPYGTDGGKLNGPIDPTPSTSWTFQPVSADAAHQTRATPWAPSAFRRRVNPSRSWALRTRMLGWLAGVNPVLAMSGKGLVTVRPDGQSQLLLSQSGRVAHIDVPLMLLEEGRFGAPGPRPNRSPRGGRTPRWSTDRFKSGRQRYASAVLAGFY